MRDGGLPTQSGVRDRFWVIGPIALLLAYFWQPALRLMAPFILTSVSSLLVLGLVLLERGASLGPGRLRLSLFLMGAVAATMGVSEAVYFARLAMSVSDANDDRCLRIEEHMLADASAREPDATLFQALGCRPQSLGPAHWPAPRP